MDICSYLSALFNVKVLKSYQTSELYSWLCACVHSKSAIQPIFNSNYFNFWILKKVTQKMQTLN